VLSLFINFGLFVSKRVVFETVFIIPQSGDSETIIIVNFKRKDETRRSAAS
jgi:hypothetical protein